jgi:hypothetical protein
MHTLLAPEDSKMFAMKSPSVPFRNFARIKYQSL